jgi:hypothetical protein
MATATAETDKPTRAERKSQLETILAQHEALRTAVVRAQGESERQDGFLRDVEAQPAKLAALGEDGFDAETKKRTSLRMVWGKAQLALSQFERENKIAAIRAELAGIVAEEDLEAQRAARQELLTLMHEFQREILDVGAELQAAIDERLAEVERRWPGQRVQLNLPHMPPTIFTTHGGLRSLPLWHRECLAAAAPELFPADDPARLRIESERKQHRQPVIWHPSSPAWS